MFRADESMLWAGGGGGAEGLFLLLLLLLAEILAAVAVAEEEDLEADAVKDDDGADAGEDDFNIELGPTGTDEPKSVEESRCRFDGWNGGEDDVDESRNTPREEANNVGSDNVESYRPAVCLNDTPLP